MTVLHVIDHMGLGGAQRAVIDHLNARHQDKVFILRRKRSQFDLENYSGQIVNMGIRTPLGLLFIIPHILAALYRENVQVLHCHLRASWFLGWILSLSHSGTLKFIFHERGWIMEGSLIYRWLVRACAKRGTIVSVSRHVAAILAEIHIPLGDIQVVHNGLDLDYFRVDVQSGESLRSNFGISKEVFVVGFSGRLIEHKGWKDFLGAVQLFNSNLNIFALIAGGGPDYSQIVRFIEDNNLSERVQVLINFSDMRSFYNSLNVFVFPSHWEPLGRGQIEAQACGTPVIASEINGITEVISSDNAYLIPPNSPRKIYQAIQTLMDDSVLYNSYQTNGISNSRRFSFPVYMESISRLYRQSLR